MNLARMIAMSDVLLRGHVFNWFWRDRATRRAVRSDVISRIIPRYFKRYLPAAAAVVERPVVRDDKNEKIWSIWLQGEKNAPDLVQACFRSIRKNCRQELVVLDEKQLRKFITLPDIIWKKRAAGKIKNAHFADICRVELLYEYGGIWMDSTDFALQLHQFLIGLSKKISLCIWPVKMSAVHTVLCRIALFVRAAGHICWTRGVP